MRVRGDKNVKDWCQPWDAGMWWILLTKESRQEGRYMQRLQWIPLATCWPRLPSVWKVFCIVQVKLQPAAFSSMFWFSLNTVLLYGQSWDGMGCSIKEHISSKEEKKKAKRNNKRLVSLKNLQPSDLNYLSDLLINTKTLHCHNPVV